MSSTTATTTRDGFIWTPEGPAHGLQTKAVVPSKITQSSYDVIVIGAGFAGLTAARDISQRSNLNVLVLEARDRIGGRTYTSRAFDMDVEMGGTWVHWHQPHVWGEIFRYNLQHGIKTSAAGNELVTVSADNKLSYGTDLGEKFARIDAVISDFLNIDGHTPRRLMPWPYDIFREPALWKAYDHLSIRERLEQMRKEGKYDQAELEIVENIAAGTGLATSDNTSFVEFLKWIVLGGYTLQGMIDTAGVYKIGNGGMTSLALGILSDFQGDILFDAVVAEVAQPPHGTGTRPVTITLQDGRTFTAPDVISTIPLNVLDSIKFTPELPPLHQEAVKIGHVGRGYKIHYKVSPSTTPWMALTSQRSDSPFNTGVSDNIDPNQETTSHFVGFGLANRIADVEDDKAIVSAFDTYLSKSKELKVAGYLCHDWTSDPFAQGTWCSYAPGYTTKYRPELQKPLGRVQFASSDWANGWTSFVDGAMEEGKKAAANILSSIEK